MNCRARMRVAVLFGDIFDKIRNITYNNKKTKGGMSMPMTPKEMIRLLEQNGFRYVKSNNGSHQKYRNDETKRTVSVPVHAKELTLLSKSIKPLPVVKYKDGVAYDKFDDPELRFRQRYVDLVVNEMIPAVAAEGLADFVDVFCDEGFFTPEETGRILQAGAKHGMRGKIHGQELAPSGGVEVALKHNALSVDHLESMTDEDIAMMIGTETSPTALPGTSFFLNIPFAPVRKMISAGLGPAIASDYNPGSTPSGDMKFVVSLACIKMRLLPEEALNAATINGAYAMGLSADYGSIAIGKVANFYITHPIPSIAFIPYAYTTPVIREVYLNGERQN